MSVVAVKKYDNKIVVCADSIIVYGSSKKTNGDIVKLLKIDDTIIGGAGSAAELSLMWHFMRRHNPSSATEKDVLDFFVEFKSFLKNNDVSQFNEYIMVVGNKVFYIEGMLVSEVSDYCAVGAGRIEANVAMHLGKTPFEAVKVCCELNCYVAEPILTETIEF